MAERGRDQNWTYDIAGVVAGNGELLNALISRVNMIEGAARLTATSVDALKAEVAKGLDGVNDLTIQRDTKLRLELDELTVKLEQGHATLEGLLAKVAAHIAATTTATTGTTTVDQRDVGALQEQLRFLGEKVDVQLGQILSLIHI